MTRLFGRLLSLALLIPALCWAQTASSVNGGPHPAPATRTCSVVHGTPSTGDIALSSDDFKTAETAFRDQIAKEPASEDAHLGLVRALVGEDRVAEARAEAEAMLQRSPKSSVAEVALAEALYRAADIDAALAHTRAALADDPCEGRAAGMMGSILELNGYYALEARFLDQGHRLRPDDELMRRFWMSSLPRKRREEELASYMEGVHHLSQDQSRTFSDTLTRLKARKQGECKVTSKADSTKIALQPIYGDHPHPVAFGMDVLYNNTRRRMQLDTGASGIVLTEGAARALKLTPEYIFKSGGVGDEGERDSFLAHVHSVRIGDVELTDCMVEVVAKTKLDVDGLIGMDVFRRWLVTLDYGNAMVQLDPLPARPSANPAAVKPASLDDTGDAALPQDRYIAPEMKDWGSVLRIGHDLLLPAFLSPNSPAHFLIMDTGASETNLSTGMGREIGKLHGSNTEFYGISGKVNKVYETDTTPLRVANLILPPSVYYAMDTTHLSHNAGFEISGLLGLPTLQRLIIKIDYRDNLLKLIYDPNHDVVRF